MLKALRAIERSSDGDGVRRCRAGAWLARGCAGRQLAIAAVITLAAACRAGADPYPARWFYLPTNFSDPRMAARAVELVDKAAAAGLNGVVVSDPKFFLLEKYHYDDPRKGYVRPVQRFLAACQRQGIEVIPALPVVARAHSILAYDVNLAEGYEVRDAMFEVRGGRADIVPDPRAVLRNGGFESHRGDKLDGWDFQDAPGAATRVDEREPHGGRTSLRLDTTSARPLGMCRIQQDVPVTPHRYYRVSVWLRTEGLEPAGCFNIYVDPAGPKPKRRLVYNDFTVAPKSPWTRIDTVFNSREYGKVSVWFGLWKAQRGQAWIDDAEIVEIGLVNVLRREGCPLRVRVDADGRTLVEGEDIDPVADPKLGHNKWEGMYDRWHEPPAIQLRKPLPDGTRLRVSFYHPMMVNRQQIDACMTEPKVYALFEQAFTRADTFLGSPRRYLLEYDELRTGGSCAACKATHKTPGELLAENVRRLAATMRRVRPGVEIIVYHDMFDPNSNAHDDYYLVDGTLAGSWEGLDKDMIVFDWSHRTRDATARFFAQRGLRQIGSAYVDGNQPRDRLLGDWLRTLDATPNAIGLIYTSEQDRYDGLADFGARLRAHARPPATR